MLTGLHAHRHGAGSVAGHPKRLARDNLPSTLDSRIDTLPQWLAGAGYSTAVFTSVWLAILPLPGRFGVDVRSEKPARKLASEALRWMREQTGPFFCWLHLGDAHDPLEASPSARDAMGIHRWRDARRWAYTSASDDMSTDSARAYMDDRSRAYDAAVRTADDALGALWRDLGRDDVVLAVTADHGEEMWEHRGEEIASFHDPRGLAGVGHGHNLFQVHLLVPLVLHGPGIDPGHVSENVSLTDVAPTLASLFGVSTDEIDGVSLLDAVPHDRPVLSGAIAYGHEKATVVRGDRKLLVSPGDGYEKLFTLGRDRLESAGIDDAVSLEEMRALLPPMTPATSSEPPAESTSTIEDHLRGLGYID
jgi:arylsulfatase A-like enzyme